MRAIEVVNGIGSWKLEVVSWKLEFRSERMSESMSDRTDDREDETELTGEEEGETELTGEEAGVAVMVVSVLLAVGISLLLPETPVHALGIVLILIRCS